MTSRSKSSARRCRPRCCGIASLNPNTRAEQAARRVSLWKGLDVSIAPLSAGLTNENYLVEAAGDKYVMRVPGRSTDLLSIDRENEVYNTRAAATTGIGPRILEHVPGIDVMVLEFIAGATMSAKALQSPAMAARMAESFHRLHRAPRFLHDFDMFRLIESYLRIVDAHRVDIPDGYRDWLPRVAEIERAVTAAALPTAPCHNDLLCENFIDDGTVLRNRRLRAQRQQRPVLRPRQHRPGGRLRPGPARSAVRRVLRQARPTAAGAHESLRAHVGRRLDALGRDPGQDLGRRLRLHRVLHRPLGAGARSPPLRPARPLDGPGRQLT